MSAVFVCQCPEDDETFLLWTQFGPRGYVADGVKFSYFVLVTDNSVRLYAMPISAPPCPVNRERSALFLEFADEEGQAHTATCRAVTVAEHVEAFMCGQSTPLREIVFSTN